MPGNVVWCRSEEVAHVDSADRVALLHLGHVERPPLILEGSSAVIWHLLDGDRDEATLVESVAKHFAMPVPEIEGSVGRFLTQLRELDLIEPR
jgi:hypothetical protein